MALDFTALDSAMVGAGEKLGGTIWNDMQLFAIPELKKITTQILAIEEHQADFTPEGAQALLDMQIRATIGIIVGMTTLTLLAVQAAINEILAAVKGMVNAAIGFALIP